MTKNILPLALFLVPTAFAALDAFESKMVADIAPQGRRLSAATPVETASFAAYLGDCTPTQPYTFPVSFGEGKGMVGLMSNTDTEISLTLTAGTVTLDSRKQPNVFAAM